MPTPRLREDLDRLKGAGWVTSILCEEAGFTNIVVKSVETGPLYQPGVTDLLLRVPNLYPDAALDMFWTDPELRLSNGSTPNRADVIETICQRQWRRFSWHRNGRWNPDIDWIGSHLEFVRQRFSSI